jgi:UDP-N-acetylmuramoyl-tripeptide--D-alanyl-D-alanine ligase
MNMPELYEIFLNHPLVCTDSRKITPGCIFFALKGASFNGNLFVERALESGAAWAVADEPKAIKNEQIIYVEDALSTLQKLARYHRHKLGLPIIAITGSNGKTTTKELTAIVLNQRYRVSFTQGNLNNHIGVPLTLLSFNEDTEIGVVEMGANHPGEIAALCQIAQPDYGLITNVGKAHLEGFGSFEGVIRTKSELYRYLESNGGSVFINSGNTWLTQSAGKFLNQITYGTDENNWLRGEEKISGQFLNVRIWFPSGVQCVNTQLVGNYNLENVLAAATVGQYFNVDPLLIKQGVESYIPGNNRSQLLKAGSNQIVMDAYNANPTSMQASLANFLSTEHPNRMVILGDMLELGAYSLDEHQKIVDQLTVNPELNVILVGAEFAATQRPNHFLCFEKVQQAAEYLANKRVHDFRILIKGSRGISLEKIIVSLY